MSNDINVTIPVQRQPNLTVPVTLTVTIRQVADLLCSAFEGGSNYWYLITEAVQPSDYAAYRSFPDGPVIKHVDYPVNAGGRLTIATLEADEINGRTSWVLDYDACVRGLQVMAQKHPKHFADVIDENDDADTADVFLQCCLFGEVIYG